VVKPVKHTEKHISSISPAKQMKKARNWTAGFLLILAAVYGIASNVPDAVIRYQLELKKIEASKKRNNGPTIPADLIT
jgi:hypothetical protein